MAEFNGPMAAIGEGRAAPGGHEPEKDLDSSAYKARSAATRFFLWVF